MIILLHFNFWSLLTVWAPITYNIAKSPRDTSASAGVLNNEPHHPFLAFLYIDHDVGAILRRNVGRRRCPNGRDTGHSTGHVGRHPPAHAHHEDNMGCKPNTPGMSGARHRFWRRVGPNRRPGSSTVIPGLAHHPWTTCFFLRRSGHLHSHQLCQIKLPRSSGHEDRFRYHVNRKRGLLKIPSASDLWCFLREYAWCSWCLQERSQELLTLCKKRDANPPSPLSVVPPRATFAKRTGRQCHVMAEGCL